jgi:cytoskeletal protein RodZ
MESLGQYLKKERELKNITLAEIARKTKVREHLLRAIEEEKFNVLPSAAYARSFLSAYAKSVGLDPRDVLARYESISGAGPLPSPKAMTPKRAFGGWKLSPAFKRKIGVFGGVAGGLVAIALIAFYFLSLRAPHRAGPPQPPLSQKSEPKQEVLPSVSPPPQVEKASVEEEKPFSLELKAAERTWVRVQADSQPEREMTLNPGEAVSYPGIHRLRILVGNAGGLDLIFDGKRLERFGKTGEIVTLTFTGQGATVESRGAAKTP